MSSIETGRKDINKTYLESVAKDKLAPASKQIIQTGKAPDEDTSLTIALETYNKGPDGLNRFPYPSAYVKLRPRDGKRDVFAGAFTAAEGSNVTLEAVFAMLAARQALAGPQFRYPITLFLGPGVKEDEIPDKERLHRFSRVVFGDLDIDNPYVAMVSYTPAFPRRAHAVVWVAGGKEEGAIVNDAGTRAADWWQDKFRSALANDEVLRSSGEKQKEFVRSTGSEDIHSLLWPLIKLSMTTDESKLYAPLGTASALGEKDLWKNTDNGFDSNPWHQWTMGLLAYGSIPYKKHSDDSESLPWYGLHMTTKKLKDLAETVRISQ